MVGTLYKCSRAGFFLNFAPKFGKWAKNRPIMIAGIF